MLSSSSTMSKLSWLLFLLFFPKLDLQRFDQLSSVLGADQIVSHPRPLKPPRFAGGRVSWLVGAMGSSASSPETSGGGGRGTLLSEEELRKRLTREQYYVTRQKGTERAFTGEYWNSKTKGTYHCVCCDTPLFESSTKFDSGTGWPSYYQPIGTSVKSKLDSSIIFMPRTEVLCAACDAHLGHVFDDGPPSHRKQILHQQRCAEAQTGRKRSVVL